MWAAVVAHWKRLHLLIMRSWVQINSRVLFFFYLTILRGTWLLVLLRYQFCRDFLQQQIPRNDFSESAEFHQNKFGKICAIFGQIWLHFWPKWSFFTIFLAKTPLWAKFCRFRLVCLNERKLENLFGCFLLAKKHEFQRNFFFTVKGPFWGTTWLILLDKTCA